MDSQTGLNREVKEIRVASSIGVLLIVFGHSFVTADYLERNPLWYRTVKDVIYGFHIHLFFLLSGFLLAHRYEDRPFRSCSFYRSRFVRLIVPYLFYSIVNVFINIGLPGITQYPINHVTDVLHILAYPTENTIKFHWFLVVVFNLSLTAPMVLLALRRRWWAALVLGILVIAIHFSIPKRLIMCWGISATGYYLVFFFLGAVFQRKIKILSSKIYSEHPMMAGLGSLVAAGVFYGSSSMLKQQGIGDWRILASELLFAVSAIGLVLAISRLYVMKSWDFLSVLSGLNLSILLLSWYGHRLADGMLNRVLGWGFSVVMPASFLMGIFFPILMVSLIQGKARWSDVLIGYSGRR